MTRIVCLLFALAVARLGPAAPPDVPAKIDATVLQMKRIEVATAGKEIGFQLAADAEDVFFDELVSRDGTRRFVFQAARPGTYPIVFWTKDETAGKVCTVIVTDAKPPAPPVPPIPPGPSVPLDDALVRKLRDALAKDVQKNGTADRAFARKLATVYLDAATKFDADTGTLTVGALQESLFRASRDAGIPRKDTALAFTRDALGECGFDRYAENTVLIGDVKGYYLGVLRKIGTHLSEAAK